MFAKRVNGKFRVKLERGDGKMEIARYAMLLKRKDWQAFYRTLVYQW